MTRRMLVAVLATIPVVARADRRGSERSKEARMERDLRELSERLHALQKKTNAAPQQSVLHNRAEALLFEARKETAGNYRLGRLLKACDGILDASDELQRLHDKRISKDDTRERTARELTKSYFRVKEGGFYAKQARHHWAGDLVPMAQRFYQMARHEYDAARYTRARRYAEAARELISALESLAQAAVRTPEPPEM